jgi:predicted Zn-dependent protease
LFVWAVTAAWAWLADIVRGHGDVHETVAVLSREIETKPKNEAALRFERASLLAQYEHFTEALDDLAKINEIDPGNDRPVALRGHIFRRMGKLAEARAEQEAFLKKHPVNTQVRFDYSQTLAALKETGAAIAELDKLIGAAQHPSPDFVAMRLRLTKSRDGGGPEAALAWLDGFLTTHPLPVFEEAALRLEIELGRTAAAAKRIDVMACKSPRPESLWLRKAELLASGGDAAGAAAAARAGVAAVARLPAHVRGTRACAALETRLERMLSP